MKAKLFFITGVCGAGKSSVLPFLKKMLPSEAFDVRDFDSRGVPNNATTEGWRFPETKYWIALANENAKKGVTTIISGFANPEELPMLKNEDDIAIEYILLDASEETVRLRLARRNTDSALTDLARVVGGNADAFIENNISFTLKLREICTKHGCFIIQTDKCSPEEVAVKIAARVSKLNIILTSSFNAVVKELQEKDLLPKTASVAFIPTAGDPYPERPWIDADRKALVELGYSVRDIDLKGSTADSLGKELSSHDIIFVAGGNTTYLVQQSNISGFTDVIHDLLKQGRLYIGSSAGSILAGPTVEPFVTEDLTELPRDFVLTKPTCLHLVDYIVLPHDQVEQFSAEHDKILKQYDKKLTFVRLTDKEYQTETIYDI